VKKFIRALTRFDWSSLIIVLVIIGATLASYWHVLHIVSFFNPSPWLYFAATAIEFAWGATIIVFATKGFWITEVRTGVVSWAWTGVYFAGILVGLFNVLSCYVYFQKSTVTSDFVLLVSFFAIDERLLNDPRFFGWIVRILAIVAGSCLPVFSGFFGKVLAYRLVIKEEQKKGKKSERIRKKQVAEILTERAVKVEAPSNKANPYGVLKIKDSELGYQDKIALGDSYSVKDKFVDDDSFVFVLEKTKSGLSKDLTLRK